MKQKALFLALALSFFTAQAFAAKRSCLGPIEPIRAEYKVGEITQLTNELITKTQSRLNEIAKRPASKRTVANTLIEMEQTLADFSDATAQLTFPKYTSTNAEVSKESGEAEVKLEQFAVGISTRRDLYQSLVGLSPKTADEKRLLEKSMESFEQSGMKLSDEKLAEVKALKEQLSALEGKFSENNNNDATFVEFTAEELKGAPADFLGRLKKSESGKLIVTGKTGDYLTVMENAENAETRRRMLLAYQNRGTPENTELLEKAVELRGKIANLMGYSTWVDLRTSTRMAKSRKSVEDFLGSLREKLSAKAVVDLKALLDYKKELDPKATELNQWDISYLANQLQKRDYSLDNEKIREYFPADIAVNGMFKVYSKLLGLKFTQVQDAKVWAEGVKLYEITDAASGNLIGHFYADLHPRAGKYGHAAAFTLVNGRNLPSGKYSNTVSAIVANFTPPTADKPSLMTHDEVETLFHEFGHIIHQTITRAPYASLSGSSVARDFVEAPSQMLENWVWSREVLNEISGHYKNPEQKIPQDVFEKMLAARNFMQGHAYSRQLVFAYFDLAIHTAQGKVDVTKVYEDTYRAIMKQEPIAGGRVPQSFGHMMGGYDAGYYGYLWAKVYAEDMFSTFPENDLTNPKRGMEYRRSILEKGNMRDGLELLREFLGRDPSPDAFFKKLGI